MIVTVILLHKDRIYRERLRENAEMTVGSHKKDQIQILDMVRAQIKIRNYQGIEVQVKKPFHFPKHNIPYDEIQVIDRESRTAVLALNSSDETEKVVALPYQAILTVGRLPENNVRIQSHYISGRHCRFSSEAGVISVEDLNSTNGVYVNGKKISKVKLKSGDVISLMNFRILVEDNELHFEEGKLITVRGLDEEQAFNVKTDIQALGSSIKYRRSPRTQEQLPSDPIVLASAPGKGQKFEKSRGMLASLVGTGAMMASGLAMGISSPALLAARASMLVMPVSSVASQKSGNKQRKKKLEEYELLRQSKYFNYISEQKARIDTVAEQQRNIISRENPTPRECIQIVGEMKRNLWERNESDRDFLDIRLGMGYEELCVPVTARTSNTTLTLEEDEVREMSEQLIEETRIVDNLPARVSLKENSTVGIIGERKKAVNLLKNMIISLVTAHCYEDVRLVGIFDSGEREVWESIRWLPHVWDTNKQMRFLSFSKADAHSLCEVFYEVLKSRKSEIEKSGFGQKAMPKPYYVFLFGSKEYVEQEEIMNYLFMDNPRMGISSIFLFDDMYSLPHNCKMIVDVDNGPCAYVRDQVNNKFFFTMDENIGRRAFDSFARRMSAIKLDGFAVRQPIPNSITFLQGYHMLAVNQLDVVNRWNSNHAYEGIKAPIGVLPGGKTLTLDIHESAHGPHGLVAGTTGSGKSELLQAWILSVAVNYHPHDVNFVIIDYKGGGMANFIEPLPHVVGTITNIGTNINRSLISLQSENLRRQRLFKEAKVNNIDQYQRMYKEGRISTPLPHLVIVADEFAELKKDEPDFMQGLVQVARVGRSLGVHMVLATQKPSGVVDDQIWSNTRFRLCLKVQSVGDSREMLKTPDAAQIVQAGRAYIQVGTNEVYELFQSYWSGAPYKGMEQTEERIGNQVRIVDEMGQRIKAVVDEKTRFRSDVDELHAIVDYICAEAKKAEIRKLSGPWLPELPKEIFVINNIIRNYGFDGEKWNGMMKWLKVPIGVYDIPEEQAQGIQYLDFADEGHYGIYGAPATGKTTLLKSIVLSIGLLYKPEDVVLYILDFGGWGMSSFSKMPHVGGVVLDSEEEKMEKFSQLILGEFEERKKIFLQHTVSSLAAYRQAVAANLPAIIVVIDNMAPLFDLYPDMESLFITIARDGASYGIYLVYTANSTSGIKFKVLQNVRGAVAFDLTDRADFSTIVGRLEGRTLPKIDGRGFYKGNPPVEFQASMYMEGKNDMERVQRMTKFLSRMDQCWKGSRPKAIPIMPETVGMEEMMGQYQIRYTIPLGISYADILPAMVNLSEKYCFVAAGENASKNAEILKMIVGMVAAKSLQDKIFVLDSDKAKLASLEGTVYKYVRHGDAVGVKSIMDEIVDMLNQRKREQNTARYESAEQFDEQEFILGYEQICIFVDDICGFVDTSEDDSRNSMERICRLAEGLGVMVFVSGLSAELTKYNEIESLTRAIVMNQKGVVTDSTPSQNTFFHNSLKYNEKAIEPGEGNAWFFDEGKCERIKLIG